VWSRILLDKLTVPQLVGTFSGTHRSWPQPQQSAALFTKVQLPTVLY